MEGWTQVAMRMVPGRGVYREQIWRKLHSRQREHLENTRTAKAHRKHTLSFHSIFYGSKSMWEIPMHQFPGSCQSWSGLGQVWLAECPVIYQAADPSRSVLPLCQRDHRDPNGVHRFILVRAEIFLSRGDHCPLAATLPKAEIGKRDPLRTRPHSI